ncbi:RecT family recombinase [Bacillaceae bacterium CLA-AA-H227]|uniref:RecT family recombinase n=1 Tax=Robertmurraya yapensis (ex Hitch et al 2024) TaxID=3133160 RepID=A0ACC6SGS0_9BACI
MEKAMVFTEEQKSLIWRTKVQPKNGTSDDARIFVEVCEQYGLNPLLGDIVFNRYETANGPVVNFIVTRDAYLKAAMRDKDFVKCVSAVIREGDHFEMDIDGNVIHKFGVKRGKIISAWAFAEHAFRGKLPVVVDFEEYFNANAKSRNGRSPVWDSMPSAMIQKVAEVAALRRQFPLGGIVAAEELGMDGLNDTPNVPVEQPQLESEQGKQEEKKPVSKKDEKPKPTGTKRQKDKEITQQEKTPEKQEEKVELTPTPAEAETTDNTSMELPLEEEKKPVEKAQLENNESVEKTDDNPEEVSYKAYTVLGFKNGHTPGGKAFIKVAAEDEAGNKLVLLASGDTLEALDEVEENQKVLFHVENINGYDTVMKVGGLAG